MAAATQKTWFPRRLHLFVVGGDVISSSRHKLMVGALGHVVPRAHQHLELRERGVDFPRDWRLLRFFPVHLDSELLEIAEHWKRELDYLHLRLGLRLESRGGASVPPVKQREAVNLHGGEGMVESPPQLHGQPV